LELLASAAIAVIDLTSGGGHRRMPAAFTMNTPSLILAADPSIHRPMVNVSNHPVNGL
jgi:hypothetical protein